MTLDVLLAQARLKELAALRRIRRAIAANITSPEWAYCVAAMDRQMHLLQDLVACEDPQVLRDAQEILDDERRADALVSPVADIPAGQRMH